MSEQSKTEVVKVGISQSFFETNVSGVFGTLVNGKTLTMYLYEGTLLPPQSQTIKTEIVNGKTTMHVDVDPTVKIGNIVKGKINITIEDTEKIAKWMLDKVKESAKGSSDGSRIVLFPSKAVSAGRSEEKVNILPNDEYFLREFVVGNKDASTTSRVNPSEKLETERDEIDMNENDWAKQYIESVDRSISDIRKEGNENRREIKNEIRAYAQDINKKFDITMDELRQTRKEVREDVSDIKQDIRDIKKDNNDTRKWILGVGISVIVAIAAMAITVILSMPRI